MDNNFGADIAELKANQKTIFHEMDEIKSEVKDLSRLTTAVEVIATETKATREQVDKIDHRLETIEHQPVKDYNKIKQTVICAVISTIVGGVLGAIISLVITSGGA